MGVVLTRFYALWMPSMPETKVIATQIRPMVAADLALVLAWRNHSTVRRFMFTQNEITLDEHERWFKRSKDDRHKHLLIFEMNGQPQGFISFHVSEIGGIAKWGFYAAPEASKGCGRQLGRSALDYVFTHLKLNKICGEVLAYNTGSIKLHQSLGFLLEGILLDQYFNGEDYCNVICFGLLRHDWQANT